MIPVPVPLLENASVNFFGFVTPRIVKSPGTSKVSGPVARTGCSSCDLSHLFSAAINVVMFSPSLAVRIIFRVPGCYLRKVCDA